MWIKKHLKFIASVIILVVYLFTLAPSVIQIDAGELATVQYTLGIAHPTGYPLFTLVGYLFLHLPLGIRTITHANILAAIWCVSAVYFLMKTNLVLLENFQNSNKLFFNKKISKKKLYNFNNDQKTISIISGAFFLSFSKTFWLQSTSVEVYSLQAFLFSLIIYSTVKSYCSSEKKLINWLLVGFSFSLGFSNHMSTLYAVPFSAVLFFNKEKFNPNSIKIILKTVVLSILLLALFYSYLPIRANQNPILNWGNVVNFENFWRHITGKQYQVWLFSSFNSAEKQLKYFISNFPDEFTYVGLFLGFVGIYFMSKINKTLLLSTSITFVFTIAYSINYDIVDIDSYFLLSYLIFSIWITFGILFLFEIFSKAKHLKKLILPVLIIITSLPFLTNKNKVNQNDVYIYEDYTKTILNSVEKNSIILSYQWDYFISPSYYFQFVENFRRDVAVVDKELLRRSWYYNQMNKNFQQVFEKIKNESQQFINSVLPFERNENYNAYELEKNYQMVMTNLISKNISERNCYIGLELFQNEIQNGEFVLPEGYTIVPYNLLFKIVKGNDYVEAPLPNFKIRFPRINNKYTDFIRTTIATMLTYRAAYEIQFNKIEKAKIYLEKVKDEFPEFNIPVGILNSIGM